MTTIKLIQLEWSKWSKNSVFKTLMITYLALSPSLIFMGKMLNQVPPLPSPSIIFEFPNVWDYLGYSGSWLAFFCLGYFGVYMITSEYGWRTLRQSIINGQTRLDLLKGKLLFILIISLIAAIYYMIAGIAIGVYHSATFTLQDILDTNYAPVRYFLMVLAYMIFGMMAGVLVKRSGLALFTYFTYILFAERLVRWLFHYKLFGGNTHYYYPMNAVSDLMPNPLMKFADGVKVTSGTGNEALHLLQSGESITLTTIYVILFIAVSWMLLKKRDL